MYVWWVYLFVFSSVCCSLEIIFFLNIFPVRWYEVTIATRLLTWPETLSSVITTPIAYVAFALEHFFITGNPFYADIFSGIFMWQTRCAAVDVSAWFMLHVKKRPALQGTDLVMLVTLLDFTGICYVYLSTLYFKCIVSAKGSFTVSTIWWLYLFHVEYLFWLLSLFPFPSCSTYCSSSARPTSCSLHLSTSFTFHLAPLVSLIVTRACKPSATRNSQITSHCYRRTFLSHLPRKADFSKYPE